MDCHISSQSLRYYYYDRHFTDEETEEWCHIHSRRSYAKLGFELRWSDAEAPGSGQQVKLLKTPVSILRNSSILLHKAKSCEGFTFSPFFLGSENNQVGLGHKKAQGMLTTNCHVRQEEKASVGDM